MTRKDIYRYVLNTIFPTEIVRYYLGSECKVSGNSLVYYSPLREKERTPSFFVEDEKGIHDFGTGEHYNIISFVSKLFVTSYWNATKKIIIDFNINLNDIKNYQNLENIKENKEDINIKLVPGNKPKNIICYFDEIEFKTKPKDNCEIIGIKNRIQQNNFKYYTDVEEVKKEILRGKTCIPSAIRGNAKENWKRQQIFLIDFDNKIDGEDITIKDCRHITVEKILDYCKEKEIIPTFIYNTFSNTEYQHKFRMVYVFENPITDINMASQIINLLLKELKRFNPDISKKNLSDMFFGGVEIKYSSNNYYKLKGDNNEKNK